MFPFEEIKYRKAVIWSALLFATIGAGVPVSEGFNVHEAQVRNRPAWSGNASFGTFSVLSYNVAGLPEIISSAVAPRSESTSEIGQRLGAFDVVHVQEDFNYHNELYRSAGKHAFKTNTKGPVVFGDGLNSLSRFPVTDIRRIAWGGLYRCGLLHAEGIYVFADRDRG